jgi:tetratricopeptide (TPR) repeat protein
MQSLAALLAIEPSHPTASNLLLQTCQVQAALTPLPEHPIHQLLEAHPHVVPLRSVAASLCQSLGAHEERFSHLEKVKALGVKSENFLVEWVKALRDLAQHARALDDCRQALRDHPASLPLLKLRAELYLALSEYDKALADGEEIVKRDPADHYARTTLGSIRLLMSDCRDGYEDYAAHGDFAREAGKLQFGIPAWKGEKLQGKKLLLWSSQGIGDIVMFAGFLPWVLAQGARVTLATGKKLIPLFTRSFPEVELVDDSPDQIAAAAGRCQLQAVLGQLMAYGLPHYIPARHPPYL